MSLPIESHTSANCPEDRLRVSGPKRPAWWNRACERSVTYDVRRRSILSVTALSVASWTLILVVATASPQTPSWVGRFDDVRNHDDYACCVASSPDGSRVFVTGSAGGTTSSPYRTFDIETIAYRASTGRELWTARFGDRLGANDYASSIAVSPDGARVFVTGTVWAGVADEDFISIAYDASTGEKLWKAQYNGPRNADDFDPVGAVAPDGSSLYITGTSFSAKPACAVIAYEADSGTQLWVNRYRRAGLHGNCSEDPHPIVVSPDGGQVFLGGNRWGPNRYRDFLAVAFDAQTGEKRWASVYTATRRSIEGTLAIAVAPDSSRVFLTGYTARRRRPLDSRDVATVAFDATTGTEVWATTYDGPGHGPDGGIDVAVSPDSSSVFVTGGILGTGSDDSATLAYDAATGTQVWAARYDGPAHLSDFTRAVVPNPNGRVVYVTGQSTGARTGRDLLTIAYRAADSGRRWVARFDGRANLGDESDSIAISPSGTDVFVSGPSEGQRTGEDYVTVAYPA
jgi:outer membrane protein assembly factor BamB